MDDVGAALGAPRSRAARPRVGAASLLDTARAAAAETASAEVSHLWAAAEQRVAARFYGVRQEASTWRSTHGGFVAAGIILSRFGGGDAAVGTSSDVIGKARRELMSDDPVRRERASLRLRLAPTYAPPGSAVTSWLATVATVLAEARGAEPTRPAAVRAAARVVLLDREFSGSSQLRV